MSSGELRFLVEVQAQTDGEPVAGDYSSPTWSKHCDAWASVQYSAGKDVGDDRDSTIGAANIKIRYRPDITNSMRVFHDGKEFEIIDNFDINGRRKYLMIRAQVINK